MLKTITRNLLLLLSFLLVAVAQPAPPQINLIIEREGVRFDQTGAAAAWQIEVYNQTGELVFASGVTRAPSLAWSLHDQQGRPLASGLYNYRLRMQNENNEVLATQTGHVIVNRASGDDRIWVTSNRKAGVGAQDPNDLTVISADDSAIGGAQLARAAGTTRTTDTTRTTQDRQTGVQAVPEVIGPITGEGTGGALSGRLARFNGENSIINSSIEEVTGNIRINTNLTQGRLSVVDNAAAGIYGQSNTWYGIYGRSTAEAGVRGQSNTRQGVFGTSTSHVGVQGNSNTGIGVDGSSASAAGVRGQSNTSNGVEGISSSQAGVRGQSNTGFGLHGFSNSAAGVRGESVNANGIFGSSTNFTGVRGVTNSFDLNESGVRGVAVNSGAGVRGEATTGAGTSGSSTSGNGVVGTTNGNSTVAGVLGTTQSIDGRGVLGRANGDSSGMAQGVRGESNFGAGVYGSGGLYGTGVVGSGNTGVVGSGALGPGIVGNGTIAGQFNGRVNITGNTNVGGILSKGGGAFKIDHPLDPENKYLYHSFVESPDMLNIYNGTITTDENGVARVTMPDYFAALNRDFRYQLTVIGQFAQAIVAEKIADNHFTIKTDKPHVEVSWQVTGVRQDAFANQHRIPNEVEKTPAERGYYLHPEAFGKSNDKNIEAVRQPKLWQTLQQANAERAEKAKPTTLDQ